MYYDPRFIAFAQWLYANPSGNVAAHMRANGFIPDVIDASGNFRPAITVSDGASITHPGEVITSAPIAWVSAPLELAAQALRGRDFDWLNVSVRHYGPNCSPADVAAAVAASGV